MNCGQNHMMSGYNSCSHLVLLTLPRCQPSLSFRAHLECIHGEPFLTHVLARLRQIPALTIAVWDRSELPYDIGVRFGLPVVDVPAYDETDRLRLLGAAAGVQTVVSIGIEYALAPIDLVARALRAHQEAQGQMTLLENFPERVLRGIFQTAFLDELQAVRPHSTSSDPRVRAELYRAAVTAADPAGAVSLRYKRFDAARSYGLAASTLPASVVFECRKELRRARRYMADSGAKPLLRWKETLDRRRERVQVDVARRVGNRDAQALRVTFCLNESLWAGAQAALVALIGSLDRTRVECSAIVSRAGRVSAALEASGIPVECAGGEFHAEVTVEQQLRMAAAVRAFKPHVMHLNGTEGLFVLGLARMHGAVVLQHARLAPRNSDRAYQCCDHVIAVSAFVEQALWRLSVPRSLVTMIHDGLPDMSPSADPMHLRERMGYTRNDVVVAVVGRIEPRKRPHLAIAALALARRARRLKLLIVGPLDHPAEYIDWLWKEVVRSDLQEDVQFLGFRENMADLYAASDVVLVCGQNEALPLCAIEAGIASRPVVACGASGAAEIVDHGVNGLTVAESPELIADALVTLAQSSDVRIAMGFRGRQIWKEKFSAERCASRTLALYEALVSRSRRTRLRAGH